MLPGPDLIAQLRDFVEAEGGKAASAAGGLYSGRDHVRFRRKVRQCVDVLGRILPTLELRLDARLVRAALEIDLVDRDGAPAMRNHDVVARLADPAFAEEVGQFNLEIELAPTAMGSAFLTQAQASLQAKLDSAQAVAAS
jgi:hypothetical protein